MPHGIRLRTAPLTAGDLQALLWVLPPLAVLTAAHLVFELVAGAYAELARGALAAAPGRPMTAATVQAGFSWSATALVYVVVAAGSAAASLRILRSRVQGPALRPFRRLALAIALAGLVHLAVVDALGLPLRAIFHVTFDGLAAAGTIDPLRLMGVRVLVAVINVMSVAVPALLLTAAAASALPPLEGWDEASLARRMRQVKEIVGVAAAFMVAGILHMGAWTHWAEALIADGELGRLATGVTLYWSAAFTLMIAAFYLPMASVLRRLAEQEMDRQAVDLGLRTKWLTDRGLSVQVNQQLPQIAAMAAPLVVGPLSEAVRAGVGNLGL